MKKTASTLWHLLTISIVILAWLGATNHCALGLMRGGTVAAGEHSHCAGGGAKDQAPGDDHGQPECCKTIQGTAGEPGAKLEVQPDASMVVPAAILFSQFLAPPLTSSAASEGPVHDPPRRLSFAEQVLQVSLPGLAPPARG